MSSPVANKPSLTYLVREPIVKIGKPPLLILLHGVGSNEKDFVVKEITTKGGAAAFCKVDISNASQVEEMVKFAVKTYGRLGGFELL